MKVSSIIICILMFSACASDNSSKEAKEIGRFVSDLDPKENGCEFSFLTSGLFEYTYFDEINKEIAKTEWVGKWMQFYDDCTFTSGLFSKQYGNGEFTYNHDLGVLELRPSPGNGRPSEWNIISVGDKIVLAGTSKYGDNAVQMRWERRMNRPSTK